MTIDHASIVGTVVCGNLGRGQSSRSMSEHLPCVVYVNYDHRGSDLSSTGDQPAIPHIGGSFLLSLLLDLVYLVLCGGS